jgi:hypothetical protein
LLSRSEKESVLPAAIVSEHHNDHASQVWDKIANIIDKHCMNDDQKACTLNEVMNRWRRVTLTERNGNCCATAEQ